ATLLHVLSVAPPGGLRERSARGGRGLGGADPPQSSLRRGRADGAPGGRGHAQARVMRCRWISALPSCFRRRRVGRALLTSNCAPDRLRRLSVDADECPPHVFGVTEADRLRDAFDRFGSRLYAA